MPENSFDRVIENLKTLCLKADKPEYNVRDVRYRWSAHIDGLPFIDTALTLNKDTGELRDAIVYVDNIPVLKFTNGQLKQHSSGKWEKVVQHLAEMVNAV